MAALTTAAIVGAAVVGTAAAVGGTVYQADQQRKAAKKQEARMEEQEAAAKEAASLDNTRDETGATVRLGRDGAERARNVEGSKPIKTSTTGSVKKRVGTSTSKPRTLTDANGVSHRIGL